MYNVYTVYIYIYICAYIYICIIYLQLYLINVLLTTHFERYQIGKLSLKVEKVDPVGGLRWKAK